jgi:hypothetical protein
MIIIMILTALNLTCVIVYKRYQLLTYLLIVLYGQPLRSFSTSTIDEMGSYIRRIKEMGVEHVIFAFMGLQIC